MVEFLDRLKKISFDWVTYSGISISPFELGEVIPDKEKILTEAKKKEDKINDHFAQGFYHETEKKEKKIAVWEEVKENMKNKLVANLQNKYTASLYYIWDSGARASDESLTQIFGMRGNTANYLGEVIETPITSSLWEGLSPFEFFISVYGAVKGMIDIALKTAEAGYLTRRLVEAAQILVITSSDCGASAGVLFVESDLPLSQRVYGRYLAQDIVGKKGEVILPHDTLLLEEEVKVIQKNKITAVKVFSPLNCQLVDSICQKCYGLDLSKPGKPIAFGEAVGVIAAQSLGEPGTQLTMRTFHTGGITGEEDITQGLPKVKQIFDNIEPEKEKKADLIKSSGKIISIKKKEKEIEIKLKTKERETENYKIEPEKTIKFKVGDEVKKGEKITAGKIDLEEYLQIVGRDICQEYITEEIRKVYNNQGIDINEKHIEIFARQMLSRAEVADSGDSDYLVGDIVNYQKLEKINQELLINKKQPVRFKNIIFSLKDLASHPDSFLAGISFQNTLKSLVYYSLHQPIDYLQGCKENLIAGQLAPVGVGLKEKEKFWRKSARRI